jgi:integrase
VNKNKIPSHPFKRLHLPPSDLRLSAWSEAFEAWLSAKQDERTRRFYRLSWDDFLAYLGKAPWDACQADVLAWRDHLLEDGYASIVAYSRLTSLSSFYRYIARQQRMPTGWRNPCKGVKRPVYQARRPLLSRPLSLPEARDFLQAVDRYETVMGLRDYAFFLTCMLSGLHTGSIRQLRFGDLRRGPDQTTIHWRWRRNEGMAALPQPCAQAIQEYLDLSGRWRALQPEHYIFVPLGHGLHYTPRWTAEDWNPGHPLNYRYAYHLLQMYAYWAGLHWEDLTMDSLRGIRELVDQAGDQGLRLLLGYDPATTSSFR